MNSELLTFYPFSILRSPIPTSMVSLKTVCLVNTVALKINNLVFSVETEWVWSSPKAQTLEIYHYLSCLAVPWKIAILSDFLCHCDTEFIQWVKSCPQGLLFKNLNGNCLTL